MSDVDEKQLVLYAQMANLVNLILQLPENEINVKEIAVNFSKVFEYVICLIFLVIFQARFFIFEG